MRLVNHHLWDINQLISHRTLLCLPSGRQQHRLLPIREVVQMVSRCHHPNTHLILLFETPLNQLSNISVEDSQTLAISPWEEKFIPEIEQTIVKANIGLNPVTTGNVIRIPLPPLTEERRVELTKQVKTEEEQAKVSIRNIRRDSIQDLKEYLNEKMISEDDFHKGQSDIQEITDSMTGSIESVSQEKQKDVMTI